MTQQQQFDTDSINASIDIVELVSRYTTLKKDGKDFKALCLFHTEKSPSMTVVPDKGFVHCFGCGAHHDAISFFMAVESLDFKTACGKLLNGSGTTGAQPIPQRTTRLKKAPPRITTAPPADNAKPDMRIRKLGDPQAVYTYTTATGEPLGYVARYLDSETNKKTIRCWTFGSRTPDEPPAWSCGHFSLPRPLYNAHELANNPNKQVLIVEGEKAADAARRLFPGMVAITWPAGTESVDRADWAHLNGRKCVLLPDNDEPGRKAMQRLAVMLHKEGAIEIKGIRSDTAIDGTPAPEGWDVADAPADTTPEQALAWARANVFTYESGSVAHVVGQPAAPPAQSEPPASDEIPLNAYSDADAQETPEHTPDSLPTQPTPAPATIGGNPTVLAVTDKGALLMNLDNAVRAIELETDLVGHIWYDEFLDAVLTDWQGPVRQWRDADDKKLCLYLQRHIGLTRISTNQAADAAMIAAFHDTRNELKEYLNGLEWDGTERLAHLLSDGFGADHNIYTQAVGRCWMVSMVARALKPGCKVDTVPVLEGKQGKQKSSALQIIGGKWFVECHENVMSKDFYGVLTGHILVEISEMHSFTRSEVERIKGIVSCQVDRYRKAYGRHTEDHPRHTVLVGTTNRDDYHKDETGGRRFLPVLCNDINLAWLEDNRDQVWAEAVALYSRVPEDAKPAVRVAKGAAWWDIPEAEQRAEIDARRDVDSWEQPIEQWLKDSARTRVNVSDILSDCLNIEVKDHDQMRQKRVGRVLRALGWVSKVRRDTDGRNRKVWVREE